MFTSHVLLIQSCEDFADYETESERDLLKTVCQFTFWKNSIENRELFYLSEPKTNRNLLGQNIKFFWTGDEV